jgi:PBP1b-binding outer membrane lipoprotein LpoB
MPKLRICLGQKMRFNLLLLGPAIFLSGCANTDPVAMETAVTHALHEQQSDTQEKYEPARSPGYNDLIQGDR